MMASEAPPATHDGNGDDDAKREGELLEEIRRLRREKNAVILAHYYQIPAIQDVADYVGDSLGLSRKAAATDAAMIVFAGVHFMAETARILNPHKKVVVPDLAAGCSLAESAPADRFRDFVHAHPDHVVVTYVNCSAEVKALSDIVCTSSNAEAVIESIPRGTPIIFAPDRNLGHYLAERTGRPLLLWDGACIVHEAFAFQKLEQLMAANPEARLIAHPESLSQVLELAEYVGSTAGMLEYVRRNGAGTYIVATEVGLLHQMARDVPKAKLIAAPVVANNACACSECPYMKLNTVEKLYRCLRDEQPEVTVPEEIGIRALRPIERMLAISGG